MLLSWTSSGRKSSARKFGVLFANFVLQNTATLSRFAAWRFAGIQHMPRFYGALNWNQYVAPHILSSWLTESYFKAINQWIDSMDETLSGKARVAARRRQKKWRLSPDEWELLAKLCAVLKVRNVFLFSLAFCLYMCQEIPRCDTWILANENTYHQQSSPAIQDDPATPWRRPQRSRSRER